VCTGIRAPFAIGLRSTSSPAASFCRSVQTPTTFAPIDQVPERRARELHGADDEDPHERRS
jgi:hypothetical protein